MRIEISTVPSFVPSASSLHVQVVTLPFDRASTDLEAPPAIASRLASEARRLGFTGELGESVVAQGGGDGEAAWYALVGAGASPRATVYRRVGAAVVRLGRQHKVEDAHVSGAISGERARFLAEGCHLTGYRFDRYLTAKKTAEKGLKTVRIQGESLSGAVQTGLHTAESICFARDLANEHPGVCNPTWLALKATEIASLYGMDVQIRDEQALEAEGFGLIMAVGKGSASPPRLIHLTYRSPEADRTVITLVGKGITYDSGGYSLKPPASQLNMHLDMGGAAAVLGAAVAVGRLKPAGVEVHFIVPAAENMVSGAAVKLNEVMKSYSGQTVEMQNTDAEGRLVLGDALWYATRLEPDYVIDLATLTGACVVALGEDTAGVFTPDDAFAGKFLDAAAAVDENMWRLPLSERSVSSIKSDVADMKNIGGKWGGAITAAHFLRRFVGECAWLHVDIAGPAMTEAEWEYINKGGTGFGVATLAEFIQRAGRQ